MPEGTRPPMDASSLASSGEKMLAGMQARLDALTQPEPQKKGPNFNFSGVRDKLGQAGGWVKDKAGQAGEKAGQVKEKVTTSAKELKEKLQNWQESPLGKAIGTALVDFVKKDLPGTINKLSKENYKKILATAALKIAGSTAAKWALYKTQETAGKMWEKKYDIATGVVSGAVLRTIFITAGAEAYVAKAIASGAIAGARRLDSELAAENKPENLKARLNLFERLKKYPPEKRKQLARKIAVAGAFGTAGSLIGMELMEHTGLGNFLHEALASGAGKVGEVASGIGGVISEAKDHLPPTSIPTTPTPQATLGAQQPMPAHVFETSVPAQEITPSPTETPLPIDNLPASPIEVQTPTPVPSATPTPEIYDTAPSIPSEVSTPSPTPETVMPAQAPEMPQVVEVPTVEPPPAIPEATLGVIPQVAPVIDTVPVEPASVIDEAIKNIPPTMPLESGGTPWSVAEHLLKSANPDGNFTPGDIMKVDQELCRLNGVAVPEWGIEGKILATRIPAGFILKTDDENLLNIVKQVASSK